MQRGSVETSDAEDGAVATWRREHLVRRGLVEQSGGDDLATGGPRAAGRRRIVEGEPAAGIGGRQAMQRTAWRLIRSGALMAEVQERNSGGGRRCRCGGRAIGREMGRAGRALIEGGGGGIDLDRSDFTRMI
uniref:Uncharacterized protein n=1 Tax=Oryza rufipogon TaxID=4529 RepID=A0A0E0PXN6_ORYRU